MISRMLKINSLMKRELSQVISQELKVPDLGFITVMSIEVSRDLRHAKAFISIMGSEAQKKKGLQGLIKAKGFIQREMGHRLSMKFIPDLKFIVDGSVDYSMHIDDVLRKIKEGGDVESQQ